jgi:radical SAM-linked protein
MEASETAPCTENVCHACGVCTELSVTHELAAPSEQTKKKNPFVKELAAHGEPDSHPSLFFMKPQAAPDNKALVRLRFLFKKTGEMRFISHLDVQHLLSRAARRAGIAVSYSEGFNPQPKLALAVSLPLFQEGEGEVGEVDLSESMSPESFKDAMNMQLPEQIQLLEARQVSLKTPSLASRVGRATYIALPVPNQLQPDLPGDAGVLDSATNTESFDAQALDARAAHLLSMPRLEVAGAPEGRKENSQAGPKDIRPGIFSLAVSHEPLSLKLELACGGTLHVKPTDVLKEINPDINWRVTRLGLATPEGIPLFDLPTGLSGES